MLPATRLAATTTVNGDRPFRLCGFSLFLTTTHLISSPRQGNLLHRQRKDSAVYQEEPLILRAFMKDFVRNT
jgi:hypothetical protein